MWVRHATATASCWGRCAPAPDAKIGRALTLKLTPRKMAEMSGVMNALTMAFTRSVNAMLRVCVRCAGWYVCAWC